MLMKKGFTFIITTMVIILLISGILIFNNQKKETNQKAPYLAKNYENEFLFFSKQENLDENKINNFNLSFKKYFNSYNYSVNLCSIIETEEYLYISNFYQEPCKLIINGEEEGEIGKDSTYKIDRFINDTSIYLCSCNYKTGYNSFYLDIYNKKIKLIYRN